MIITTGVSEGLDIAVRSIVDPGDEVLIAQPSYVLYAPCVTLAGECRSGPLHGSGSFPANPDSACRKDHAEVKSPDDQFPEQPDRWRDE